MVIFFLFLLFAFCFLIVSSLSFIIHLLNFEQNGLLFAGGENWNITARDINSGKIAYCIDNAHSARVKGIFVLARNDGAADDTYLLVSASSDGVIRVWDVRMAVKEKPSPLAEFNTKSRLTCLAGTSLKSLKRPQMANSVPKEKRNIAMEGSPD
ncbi:uncharacterized protein LOC110645264 [Hevea brasiliensis]|uniref:uncharacterized protein LOC110645264 n=1 Tax=Hevea brasiliensis TaxID=3981 RepID=UPI0025E22C73|nr:uncharacterized protein LOC110645264 [Hevea brasiliensis]